VELQKLNGDKHCLLVNLVVVDGLMDELKATVDTIVASEKCYNHFNKSRTTFLQKREVGHTHISNDIEVYQKKLKILVREKWQLQNKKGGLND